MPTAAEVEVEETGYYLERYCIRWAAGRGDFVGSLEDLEWRAARGGGP